MGSSMIDFQDIDCGTSDDFISWEYSQEGSVGVGILETKDLKAQICVEGSWVYVCIVEDEGTYRTVNNTSITKLKPIEVFNKAFKDRKKQMELI